MILMTLGAVFALTASLVHAANHLCGHLLYRLAAADRAAESEVLRANGATPLPPLSRIPGRPVSNWLPEIIGAAIAGAAVLFVGPEAALLAVPLVVVSMALLICDVADHLLPDVLVYPLLWGGLLASVLGVGLIDPAGAIVGAISGYLTLWGIFMIARRVYGHEAMGRGDLKLFAAIGAWLGAAGLLPVILIASVAGSLWGLAGRALPALRHREVDDDPAGAMPFGPYLILAAWLWALVPEPIKLAHLGWLVL